MPLSAVEVEAYRRDGFAVPEYRLPPARLAEMRTTLERLMAKNPDLSPERLTARSSASQATRPS